jgi:hypothetical protein
MTLQSLEAALETTNTILSARDCANEHNVNLKTVIKYLSKYGFVWDGATQWLKFDTPVVNQLPNFQSNKPLTNQFQGITLLIPKDLIVRVKEIERARQKHGLAPHLEEMIETIRQTTDEPDIVILGTLTLMRMIDSYDLSWAEHNILTRQGFQPLSKRLPALPPIPNYNNPTEPYEPHEPNDSEPNEPEQEPEPQG